MHNLQFLCNCYQCYFFGLDKWWVLYWLSKQNSNKMTLGCNQLVWFSAHKNFMCMRKSSSHIQSLTAYFFVVVAIVVRFACRQNMKNKKIIWFSLFFSDTHTCTCDLYLLPTNPQHLATLIYKSWHSQYFHVKQTQSCSHLWLFDWWVILYWKLFFLHKPHATSI